MEKLDLLQRTNFEIKTKAFTVEEEKSLAYLNQEQLEMLTMSDDEFFSEN